MVSVVISSSPEQLNAEFGLGCQMGYAYWLFGVYNEFSSNGI